MTTADEPIPPLTEQRWRFVRRGCRVMPVVVPYAASDRTKMAVCTVQTGFVNEDELLARGNAIAAVPELLAACEEMFAELFREYGHGVANGYWPDMKPKLERWKATIEHAKGGGE